MRSAVSSLLLFTTVCVFSGCGEGRPDPKTTVKDLFTAMRESDTLAIETLVDLRAAAATIAGELPPIIRRDSLVAADTTEWLVGQLTGEGRLRQRWLTDNQIVLGKTEITGNSALVEVSFLDRVTRVQYYNKMRLEYRGSHWVITKFRTM